MLAADDPGAGGIAFPGANQVVMGVAGIRRLAEEIPAWAMRDDARWIASYNSRCIEKFGNGGGNFRRLYAGFLRWARQLDARLVPETAPALAERAADGWTAVAAALAAACEEGAFVDRWREAMEGVAEIAVLEQELFERLAERAS
jgi:hypothetical protein